MRQWTWNFKLYECKLDKIRTWTQLDRIHQSSSDTHVDSEVWISFDNEKRYLARKQNTTKLNTHLIVDTNLNPNLNPNEHLNQTSASSPRTWIWFASDRIEGQRIKVEDRLHVPCQHLLVNNKTIIDSTPHAPRLAPNRFPNIQTPITDNTHHSDK